MFRVRCGINAPKNCPAINSGEELMQKEEIETIAEMIRKLKADGITLEEVAEELNYRDNANVKWDDNLFEYSTEELELIEQFWDSEAAIAVNRPQGKNVSKKRFLNQYRYINQEIDRKVQEVSNLRRLLGKITTDYSWTKGYSGNIRGKTEDIVAKIIDLEAEINADIDRLLEAREQIGRMIENVEDPQLRLVLQYRYIDCLPWERIAVEMNYSWKQIHRLHAKALNVIKMTHNDTL